MLDRNKHTSSPPLRISPAHMGALVSRLHVIEEECREIDRRLDGHHGIFSEYTGEVPEATKLQARAILMDFFDALLAMKRDLDLYKRQVELRRVFGAHLSHIWVTLHETKGESLRGFGEVPEELKAYVDPRVEELLGLLRNLRRLLDPSTEESSSPTANGEGE